MKKKTVVAFLRMFNLREASSIQYSLEPCESDLVYVFDNIDDYKDYFISNGVEEIDESVLSLCKLCSFKSGKIVALKSSCDYFITYLRRPKKLTFEEVKDIHSRGLITQEEIAYEWEMNNYCPVDNERLCSMFDTCHDCLLSYSCARSEYEHYKEDNNYMYVRKRTMKK